MNDTQFTPSIHMPLAQLDPEALHSETLGLGGVASRVLLYPMAPPLLDPEERAALAGAIFGFDRLGEDVYPELKHFNERYGGKFDAAMKAKVQSWLMGWVRPPQHYVLHAPRFASGQWFRLFRTTMFVPRDIEQAQEARRVFSEEQLVNIYQAHLGYGARDRCKSFDEWWDATLEMIRSGTWHLAVYSPRYQAFISPRIVFEPNAIPDEMSQADRVRAEFMPPILKLYPTTAPSEGTWNLSESIRSGAYIELFGDRLQAPPFGEDWGAGVLQSQAGSSNSRIICGVIHRRGSEVQSVPVVDAPDRDAVVIDIPNLCTFLQDVYSVTAWRPPEVPAELLEPGKEALFVSMCQAKLVGDRQEHPLYIHRAAFLDAVMLNPNITPVYGRIISTLPPRSHLE